MNVIKFPGFGLEFKISNIAFTFGNIVIYKYAVCIVLRNYSCNAFCKIYKRKIWNRF